MLGEFSFEDAAEVCEQARKIVNAAGKNYGWATEECKDNTVLNSYDGGKTFKSISYIYENILKRNKTRLGNEKIKMIFDYTKDKEYRDISIMFRPIVGNAYISFNSFGFCEDSLSALFSRHSVMLKELFSKDYIKNTLFGERDSVSVFVYYSHIFDRISEALKAVKLKEGENENTLTGFGVPRNFPTFEEFESNHKKKQKIREAQIKAIFMFHYRMRNSENIKLNIPESVYEPRKDSLLIAKVLEEEFETDKAKNEKTKTVLEIGCGSGLLSIIAAKRGCEVLAADIDSRAIECAKRNAELNNAKIKAVQSNLFNDIVGKFGLIIFNPPYLPEEQTLESRTWAGGKNLEVVTEFIKHAGKHLEDGGKILIVISSLSNPESILKKFADNDFGAKIIAEQKIPWEKLLVVCARRK